MRHVVWIVLLTGCVTASSFPGVYGSKACKHAKSCDPDGFAAEYDSVGDCVDDVEAILTLANLEDCDYQSDKAHDCLGDFGGLSCNEVVPASCTNVYTDCPAADTGG